MALAVTQKAITIHQGATFSETFIITDSDGNPVDFTGWTARMQIRATAASIFAYLDLTTGGGGLTLLDPAGGPSVVEAYATPARTVQIPAEKPVYDILLTDSSGNVWKGQYGVATVVAVVTRSAVPIEESVTIKKTELDITATIAAETAFSTVASGTGYTMSGDAGGLGISEAFFRDSIQIQIEKNGIRQDKSEDINWINSQSFSLNSIVDNGDKLTIFSEG